MRRPECGCLGFWKSFEVVEKDGIKTNHNVDIALRKGFYTLGALKEVEALIGAPLSSRFDLIFGTSTGSIIAALLALGHTVDEVHELYRKHVPQIMAHRGKIVRRSVRTRVAARRSAALESAAHAVFGNRSFSEIKTGVGIVATRWDLEKPMIFKASVAQAHGRQASFVPGFGCTIAEAVIGSCSAYPFFEKRRVRISDGSTVEVIDGGYCANNPTLYAIADAVRALRRAHTDIRVLSIGVGVYPEPKGWSSWLSSRFFLVQLLQKTLNINTFSMEQLRAVLFSDIQTVRINDTFERPEMATDLMESDLAKLNMLYQRGQESFANHEPQLKALFTESA